MSLNSSSASLRALVFIKIEVSSSTLRFCTENQIAKENNTAELNFWEGRILSADDFTSGFNDFKTGVSTISSLQVQLSNGKADSSQSNLDSYLASEWGTCPITVWAMDTTEVQTIGGQLTVNASGAGADTFAGDSRFAGSSFIDITTGAIVLSDSNIVFKGIIQFPNSISFDEKQITLVAVDQRYLDQLLVASSVFKQGEIETTNQFPNLADGLDGKNIPVIYGDFSDGSFIPAYEIDGFGTTIKRYKIASEDNLASGQSPLHSIQAFRFGDATLSFTDLSSNGNASVSNSLITQSADSYVACKGKTRGTDIATYFSGTSSSLLEHPVEIIFDLLTSRLAVPIGQIDSSFLTQYSADTGLKARRWIGGTETIVTVLNEICFEFGFELVSFGGKFYLTKPGLSQTSSLSIGEDHFDDSSYSVQVDPNRSYFNSANVLFAFNPFIQNYSNATRLENSSRRSQHNEDSNMPFEMKWSYKEAPIADRVGFLMYIFSGPLQILNLKCRSYAWYLKPADCFDFTFHLFSAQKFIARIIGKSLSDFGTAIQAWNLGALKLNVWGSSGAATPSTYALASSAAYGIWHSDFQIVAGFNDTIKFTTDAAYTATISYGVYLSAASLATAIQSAMNALSTVRTISVTYDSSVRKFTIAANDGSNFSIQWTTYPELGRSILGFDVSSNSTGAATYTSNYLCIFDLSKSEAVTQWA